MMTWPLEQEEAQHGVFDFEESNQVKPSVDQANNYDIAEHNIAPTAAMLSDIV
jgi:hypothetical protein